MRAPAHHSAVAVRKGAPDLPGPAQPYRPVSPHNEPVPRAEKLAGLLRTAGLDRLARLSWRGLLIFNYPRIGRPGEHDDPDLFSATVEDLDAQVALLAARFEIVAA